MAKFDGKFFRGVIGNLIFKVVNGVQVVCARPAPGTMNQTEDTMKSADTFGATSGLSCQIRNDLSGGILGLGDRHIHGRLISRLNVIINQCRDKETLEYYFNENSFSSWQTSILISILR